MSPKVLRWWLTPKRDGERWRRAHLLDKLPGMCWASLVGWALHSQPLSSCRIGAMCHLDAAENGTCYCGAIREEAPQ